MASEEESKGKLDAKADDLLKKYKTKIDNAIEKFDSEDRLKSVYRGVLSVGIYLYFRKEIIPELETEAYHYLESLELERSDSRSKDFINKVMDGVKKYFVETLEEVRKAYFASY